MGKAADARRKRTTIKNSDPTVEYLAALEAKQRFVSTALNMGWRLALTFLIPMLIGVWADNRFDSAPSYTITGLFLGVAGAGYVVYTTVKEVNAETAAMGKKSRRRKKNA